MGCISGGELAPLPQSLYFAIERVDGAIEPRGRTRRGVEHHGHGGAQDAGVSPELAQGHSQAVVGDAVAAGEGDLLGAGGIEFGTASLEAFTAMRCGQRQCLTAIVHDLAASMTLEDADNVRDAWDMHFPDTTPNPIPGARQYLVAIGVSDGVREVQAQFDFDSVEECEHERARLDDLLRDKYGVFVSTHSSETLFGQPDERGIPERYVDLWMCVSMPDDHFVRLNVSYHYRYQTWRDEVWQIVEQRRLQQARPDADDL